MRVLMLSKACVVGHYQTKLEELAKLPDLQLYVFVPPYWRDERGIIPLERVHTQGYDLIMTPMSLNGHFHLSSYPKLSEHLKSIRPHIVHIDEEPYNFATFRAMRDAIKAGARTLFFTWQNLLRRYPPPFSLFERYAFNHARYAIAGSQSAAEILREKNLRSPIAVIPQFGVDPSQFRPKPSSDITSSRLRVGYAGRLVEEKGVQILLQALARIAGDWEMHVLGGGPFRSRLQALARELKIEPRVIWESPRPSASMPNFFHALDVLVLPSLTRKNWKEQFGRVLIEAMACSVPVIGSDSGEIQNVVGEAGLIFPEGDFESLAAHLAALARDPARRAELGGRGRARVLKQYTQARIAKDTFAVYQEIMKDQATVV